MNILILTQKVDKEDDNLGFFHEWIKKFAEKTGKVFVVANFVGEHSLPANVQIFSLGKEGQRGRLSRYTTFYKQIFVLMPQADAVFVHMIPAWAVLIWPAVAIFRKRMYLWYTHKSVTFSLRIAEKLGAKIFTASKESCRLNSPKIVITGHGIDTNRFAPKRESLVNVANMVKLLSVGRISESKNYKFLLDAIEIFVKRDRGVVLDIVGAPITQADIIYKKQLEDLIRAKNLEKNINFLGAKAYAEMPDIYNSHDILLHASETGSLDKAVLEAMSCGLPVITTSEAFRGMLDVLPKDPNIVADKIAHLPVQQSEMTIGQKNMTLRGLIIQNHNLNNLIDKILENIKK